MYRAHITGSPVINSINVFVYNLNTASTGAHFINPVAIEI